MCASIRIRRLLHALPAAAARFTGCMFVDCLVWQDNGDTALANAAFNGQLNTAWLLIQRGADVNAVNRHEGDSVLMWAAVTGSLEITELLLRHGALVNHANKKGYRALYRAAYKNHPRVVKLCVSHLTRTRPVLLRAVSL